jgi:hypothetical protein
MTLGVKITKLVQDGFVRVKEKKCRDCRMPVSDEIIEWMLEHWLHFTHCGFCAQPLRVLVTPMHGADGHFCWKIDTEYPDATEIHNGQSVSMVHEKCWRDAHKPRKAL